MTRLNRAFPLLAPALAFVAMGAVWAAFAAQVPVIKGRIGATDSVFGIVFLISSVGAILSMWVAPVFDRFMGRYSVAVASAVLGVSAVALAACQSVAAFAVALFAVSLISGVTDVVMNARVSEEGQARGRDLMSINHALFSFAYAGAALATGIARQEGVGPVAVFTTIALCIAVAAVFMVGSVAGAPPSSDAPSSSVGAVVWLGGVVVLVAFFAEVAVEGWSALLIERDLGGLATQGAAGPALLGLTMGIGRLGGHVLTRFVAETRLIALACLASALGALGAFAATTPLLAQIGFAVMGLGIALVVPLSLGLVGRSAAPARRVAAIARASAIGYAAFMFGPLLMGGVAEALSLAASFAVVAAILVAVAVFVVPAFARASAVDRGF